MTTSHLRLFVAPQAGSPSEHEDPPESLLTFLEHTYRPFHPSLGSRSLDDYRQQVRKFSRWLGRQAMVCDLQDDTLARYLSGLVADTSHSPATAKKARSTLLALWRFAYRRSFTEVAPRDVPEVDAPVRARKAWTVEDLDKLLTACRTAKPMRQMVKDKLAGLPWHGWDGRHWVALVLTAFDTSLRISALLETRTKNVDLARGVLLTAGENQKDGDDQQHSLHADTVVALRAILEKCPPRDLVFPWPRSPRIIWRHYEKVLKAAGLPAGPLDKFHKIRRTAYTFTDALVGRQAATELAGHSCDLSRHYLDKDLSRKVSGRKPTVEVIPRPGRARPDSRQKTFTLPD